MSRPRHLIVPVVLLAIAVVTPVALGAEPANKKTALRSPGVRAFKDPKTGKLREPTVEEARALAREMARKTAAPETFEVLVHPDGTKSVDLKGAFSMSLVARRRSDGSITYECRPAAAANRPAASSGEK